MGMKWGDFELIYDKEKKIYDKRYYKDLFRYINLFPQATEENIWISKSEPLWYYVPDWGVMPSSMANSQIRLHGGSSDSSNLNWRSDKKFEEWATSFVKANIFSSSQTICNATAGKNHSFITNRANFVLGKYTGHSSWMKEEYDMLRSFYEDIPIVVNNEIRIGFTEEMRSIHNQDSVFIVGGGPSTDFIDFSKYKDIKKWTMNSCFKNEKISKLDNIQLVTFLDNVNLEHPLLWSFLEKHQPIVAHEISGKGYKKINRINQVYPKTSFYHTRYRSRLGCGPRMIVLAIMLGIKDIYISGFDGYDLRSNITHSFEKGKSIPQWLKEYGPWLQDQQFVIFWDYILNTLKKSYDFTIHDLSKGQKTVKYDFIQEYIN